jgi:hypothetical protein
MASTSVTTKLLRHRADADSCPASRRRPEAEDLSVLRKRKTGELDQSTCPHVSNSAEFSKQAGFCSHNAAARAATFKCVDGKYN